MWRFLSLFLFSFLSISIFAQEGVNVRIEVRSPEKISDVFITGSREDLGNWRPDLVRMSNGVDFEGEGTYMHPDFFFFNLKEVTEPFEFKVTLGSWEEEGRVRGQNSNANYSVSAEKDTTIQLRIDYWGELGSTVMGTLDIVELEDSLSPTGFRTIRIWNSHDDFSWSGKFPTVYMADGQNLFDAKTAGYGEWEIDEFLDGFGGGRMTAIVVGIDNSPNRSQE